MSKFGICYFGLCALFLTPISAYGENSTGCDNLSILSEKDKRFCKRIKSVAETLIKEDQRQKKQAASHDIQRRNDDKDALKKYGVFFPEEPSTIPIPSTKYKLLEHDFTFTQKKGRGKITWHVHAGLATDCATIPRWAWSIIGNPCNNEYLGPAIIHDRYSNEGKFDRDIPYRTVHDMFYFALRAKGVGKKRASIMWAAVRYFGPRWSPRSEQGKWLNKNRDAVFSTGGNIFLDEDGKTTTVKLLIHQDKFKQQEFDLEWFDEYVNWILNWVRESDSDTVEFWDLQLHADLCDSIVNESNDFRKNPLTTTSRSEVWNKPSNVLFSYIEQIDKHNQSVDSSQKKSFHGRGDDGLDYFQHSLQESGCPRSNSR